MFNMATRDLVCLVLARSTSKYDRLSEKEFGALDDYTIDAHGGKESLVLRLGNTITTFKASSKLEFMPALRTEGPFDTESITIAENSTKQFE